MQILLVTVGTHGDVLPFLALGREMARRGHAVTLGAPAPFAGLARRAGLGFHPIGTTPDYERAIGEPALWQLRRGVKPALDLLLSLAEPVYRWLAETWRPGEGIVVAAQTCLGARIAQDRLGLPLVTIHLLPVFIESRHASPLLPGLAMPSVLPSRFRHWLGRGADRYVIDPAALPALNRFRATLSLPPVKRLRHWWNSPLRMILLFPAWYAPPQPDWPRQALQVGLPRADRFGDTAEPAPALAAFLDAGEPPLVFTYGSATRQGRAFFDTALAICARLGRRAVFLARQDGQVPPGLPPGIIHVPYAPLSAVLPRCAALIHHGGIGTVTQGLAAGLPQLLVPVAVNHFDEGARLTRLGVGASLSRRRFTPARAARLLGRLLTSPRVADACAAARLKMEGEDGIVQACDAVECLMPRRSRPAP